VERLAQLCPIAVAHSFDIETAVQSTASRH
jgi:hypothetical protein